MFIYFKFLHSEKHHVASIIVKIVVVIYIYNLYCIHFYVKIEILSFLIIQKKIELYKTNFKIENKKWKNGKYLIIYIELFNTIKFQKYK